MSQFGKRMDGPGGKRESRREPVLLTASVLSIGASFTVTLLDVSRTGARIQAKRSLGIGEEIWLKIKPIDLFGRIVWVDGDVCGILFDGPLANHEVRNLQARGKVVLMPGLSPEEQLGAEDWQSGFIR